MRKDIPELSKRTDRATLPGVRYDGWISASLAVVGAAVLFGTTATAQALGPASSTPLGVATVTMIANVPLNEWLIFERGFGSTLGDVRLHHDVRASRMAVHLGAQAFTVGSEECRVESDGNGPVDASLRAIESRVKSGAELMLYSVNAITSGSTESQGEVTVRLQHGGRVVNGVGADPDIVVASAKAYLSALNKLHSKAERVAAQG